MKATYQDHALSKFKPTFFGLFETQYDSLLKNVYAYIYNKPIWSSPAITCRGPVFGRYRNITLAEIQGEFEMYGYDPKLQAQVLTRVEKYVTDFKAATIWKPTPDEIERLLAVRDYFRDHIKKPTIDSTHEDSRYTSR